MFRSTTFRSPSSKTYGSRSKRTSLRYWPSLRSIRRIRSISRVPGRGLSLRSPLAREGRRSRSRAIVSQTDDSAASRTRSGVQTLPSSRSRDTSSLRNVENLCGIRGRGGRAAMLLPGLLSSQRGLPVRVSVELSAGHLTLQFKNIYSSVACRALQQERLLHLHSAAVRASAASRGSSSPTTTGHVLLGGDVGPGQRNGRSRVEGLVNARICRSVSPRVSRVSLASLVFRTQGTD